MRLLTLLLTALSLLLPLNANAASRIKDIVNVEGVRDNQLIGYGIVVGLNGTGDTVRNSPMLKQSLESMMERMGVNIRDANLNTKNAAVVMVTANLPPFVAAGSKIDVTVSAAGDAKSLLGGTLLITSLLGADGEVYAVAQGTVQTGSVSAGGASGSSITKGVPTAGRIASGANIEREIGFDFNSQPIIRLTLKNPDFTTALRIADTINKARPGTAYADNPTIVAVRAPPGSNMMNFIASIEHLPVEVDTPAKVIIDEVNGVIVIGDNVRISRVAIAQGNLTISVNERPFASQPGAFSQGQTAVLPDSQVSVEEEKGKKLYDLKETASLSDVINGLNALGVSPRDMISILQTIKAAGALQAEIEVM
ncbi:flagellar basal body P-ring protein FlgI [Asticcacaulis sp. YBE204]|uniref:flagellar basal body P-ring protein FlgI n=1 Tax=Asticcacaulis sp. YBE204 TaxID=1282363 RepID=UPI0003C3C57D|nr:flagellar basal body P-ring protein FlgI [Asticcacaulis sp. YBE204]ESQ80472.1 flagellar basal body P-ring protein [Asticcacaulis sp. YBE204]